MLDRFFLLLITSIYAYLSTSVMGVPAGPVRKTRTGSVRGYIHTLKSGEPVERYLGIPYAKPPTGPLRFMRPEPPTPWDRILDTTTAPKACVQEKMETAYIRKHNPDYDGRMSEDCLFVNIYVPSNSTKDGTGFPVLVHVHGGSNMVGMGTMFHGDVLASLGDMIVVTLNYRLGPFGFLYMPELGLMGNYGMFDQNLAFRWVKENIGFFGGDPNRITIEGHSAGSVDVGLHVLSPRASGLFQNAILQSGSPTAFWAVTFDSPTENNEARRQQNLKLFGCDEMEKEQTLKCLRQIHHAKLFNATFFFKRDMFNFSPVIDGDYILTSPTKVLANMAKNSDVQPSCRRIMVGVTKDEGSLAADVAVKTLLKMPVGPNEQGYLTPPDNTNMWNTLPDNIFSKIKGFKVLAQYIYGPWPKENNATANIIALSDFFGDATFTAPTMQVADALAKIEDTKVYVYSFNHVSSETSFPRWMGVPHGEDQFYLFGCPIEGHKVLNYTQTDKDVSFKMIQVWSQFIHNSDKILIPDESMQVPPYTVEGENYLEISTKGQNQASVEVRQGLRKRFMYFWNNLLPQLNAIQSSGLDSSKDTDNSMLWITTALLCLFAVSSLILLIVLIYYIRNASTKSIKHLRVAEDSDNNLL